MKTAVRLGPIAHLQRAKCIGDISNNQAWERGNKSPISHTWLPYITPDGVRLARKTSWFFIQISCRKKLRILNTLPIRDKFGMWSFGGDVYYSPLARVPIIYIYSSIPHLPHLHHLRFVHQPPRKRLFMEIQKNKIHGFLGIIDGYWWFHHARNANKNKIDIPHPYLPPFLYMGKLRGYSYKRIGYSSIFQCFVRRAY